MFSLCSSMTNPLFWRVKQEVVVGLATADSPVWMTQVCATAIKRSSRSSRSRISFRLSGLSEVSHSCFYFVNVSDAHGEMCSLQIWTWTCVFYLRLLVLQPSSAGSNRWKSHELSVYFNRLQAVNACLHMNVCCIAVKHQIYQIFWFDTINQLCVAEFASED